MRFGYFIAIILFFVTILSGFMFYWDLQDGQFSGKMLFVPIFTFFLIIVMLLFPGSIITKETSNITDNFESEITPERIKTVGIMFGLMMYCYFWALDYFNAQTFFTFSKQLSILMSMLIIFLFVRWYLNKK